MHCPVCQAEMEGAAEGGCGVCGSPPRALDRTLALMHAERGQRNGKIALAILLGIVVVLSAAFIHFVATDRHEPGEADQLLVSGDSLRNLVYTLEERQRDVETLSSENARLEAKVDSLLSDSSARPQAAVPAASTAGSHIVKAGETLWGIARTYFGDGYKNRELAALNGISNPAMIVVGCTLKLH